MLVCDKCKKEPVCITIPFKTKKFDICETCAKKLVAWLEDAPLKEKLKKLYDNTNRKYNVGTIGGGI